MKFVRVILILGMIRLSASNFRGIFEAIGEQLKNLRYTIRGPSIQHPVYDKDTEEYDFVVVGAGSSGSVLAARLSENPNWNILLIEAGNSESPLGQIPTLGSVMATTQYSWTYKTVPQNNSCFGRLNNRCILRTGRGLGGGSAINGIVYARGSAHDFDEWAERGNQGWSYEDVMPYFKKSEKVMLNHFDFDYHGHDGPLTVEDDEEINPETAAFLAAGRELGYEIRDYNGKKSVGISPTQYISKNGRRQSTSTAYLEPIRHRSNLIIKTNSHAMKILFDEQKNVKGIEYKRNNRYLVALIKKELIISCGALNSPQLLMASGIGPAEHLESLTIPIIKDLRVGYNLLDHFSFVGINLHYDFPLVDNITINVIKWLLRGTGSFRSGGIDALAYHKTSQNLDYPDIELALVPVTLSQGPKLLKIITNIDKHVYDSVWKLHEGKKGFVILVILTKPKSVGRLEIRSNNTLKPPLINPNYLSHQEDIETLLKGIRTALNFGRSLSIKELGVKLNILKVSGCEKYPFDSDDYWMCTARIQHITAYHYQGTCKMGPSHDPEAVVDSELRVYGVNRLRVIDTSVIPVSITGHLEAVAVMLAEKAGDLIKNIGQRNEVQNRKLACKEIVCWNFFGLIIYFV